MNGGTVLDSDEEYIKRLHTEVTTEKFLQLDQLSERNENIERDVSQFDENYANRTEELILEPVTIAGVVQEYSNNT